MLIPGGEGSSPLARGTRVQWFTVHRGSGLIPARAGNTRRVRRPASRTRAHPRSRGEHNASNTVVVDPPGSSPLARGTLKANRGGELYGGLIPARAGNTFSASSLRRRARAHPRSRGEHRCTLRPGLAGRGSSPLARGTLGNVGYARDATGLIPARAGNTCVHRGHRSLHRAHPRSRGEHLADAEGVCYYEGSSPLARGTHYCRFSCYNYYGLIPARAGNTLADMGLYPLYRQNRITLKPEPKSRIHDKQQLLTTTSTAIPARLTPP